MRSARAIRWTLLGLAVTALAALALEALGRRSAALAVLQLGMLLCLGTGLALDRRWSATDSPDRDDP